MSYVARYEQIDKINLFYHLHFLFLPPRVVPASNFMARSRVDNLRATLTADAEF
jgi:hypothetical protein